MDDPNQMEDTARPLAAAEGKACVRAAFDRATSRGEPESSPLFCKFDASSTGPPEAISWVGVASKMTVKGSGSLIENPLFG